MPDPVRTTISAVQAYKAVQNAIEAAKDNDLRYAELRKRWQHVARLIQSCIHIGFDSSVPALQLAYASHMEDTAATLVEARNIWYDYLLTPKLLKFSKAESVRRCLEETFKKLKDQEQSLINIVTVETYNLVKQIAAGNTITYVKRELPSCVTSLLTTSATGSVEPGTNTKVVLLYAKLARGNQGDKIDAAYALNRALSSTPAQLTVSDIVQAGGLDVIQLLDSDNADVSSNAAWVVAILAENNDLADIIAQQGVIPPLIRLLNTGNGTGQAKAASTLQCLARNSDDYKVTIAKEGGIPPLICMLESGTAAGKLSAAYALNYLAMNSDNQVTIAREGGIQPLIRMVDNGTDAIKARAAGVLMYLASHSDNRAIIGREGGIPSLFRLLHTGTETAQAEAASAIRQLAMNSNNQAIIEEEKAARQGPAVPLTDLPVVDTMGLMYRVGNIKSLNVQYAG